MKKYLPRLVAWLAASHSLAAGAASSACAVCHQAIYDAYGRTPMAFSSGRPDAPNAAAGEFSHEASGFRYRVSWRAGVPQVSFDKPGEPSLRGEKSMPYYVGSGAAARAYLIESEGFLFVSPVAWYPRTRQWNLGPAFGGYGYPFLTRPALPGCLNCHASFLAPVSGTQNRFADPPWGEGGVACERCHGPGEAHIARGAPIVNPAKLPSDRRDSVCAQCHLQGEARVTRLGANWNTYQAGDRLGDSIAVFVNRAEPGMRVTSHVENLEQSSCKRGAGDKLWCGTCHNPHSLTVEVRRKCLDCHSASAKYKPHGDRCELCHMPKSEVTDAEHVVFTDHSIPRRRRQRRAPAPVTDLAPFGSAPAAPRDTALAYAIAATRQPGLRQRAQALLEIVAASSSKDPEVLLYLAEIYRNSGQNDRALSLYQPAASLDPSQLTASVGMGAVYFQRGEFAEAIRHWEHALAKNPGLVLVATNLAMAHARVGNRDAALAVLRKVRQISPGFRPAAGLLQQLSTQTK